MRPRDVEGEVISVLASAVSAEVRDSVPNPRPAEYVRVRRIGGTGRNLVQETPMLLVECWAVTSAGAFELAAHCYDVVDEAFCSSRVRPSSPVNLPDPATEDHRYQFSFMPVVNLV